MLVKKVNYFEEFGYLNRACIRKTIILMFSSYFCSKTRDRSFSWFPTVMLVPGKLLIEGLLMTSVKFKLQIY